MKIALLNGANEIELPWYERAEYSDNLGMWNVNGNTFTTKLEVYFPAAPDSEFLDYRESKDVRQPINGWVIYPTLPCGGPIFYGQLSPMPIYIGHSVTITFYLAIDLSRLTTSVRNAALHALFGEPQRPYHRTGIDALVSATEEEMSMAKAYNMDMGQAVGEQTRSLGLKSS